jgi:hypothetical protein
MSQVIVDDHLDLKRVVAPLHQWITTERLQDLRVGEHILDDRVPEILRTLKQPTFVTIDQDFWNRRLCDPSYSVLYFDLRDDQQQQIPDLLRALLRQSQFRTRARRLGKVARVTGTLLQFWQFPGHDLHHLWWNGPKKK